MATPIKTVAKALAEATDGDYNRAYNSVSVARGRARKLGKREDDNPRDREFRLLKAEKWLEESKVFKKGDTDIVDNLAKLLVDMESFEVRVHKVPFDDFMV